MTTSSNTNWILFGRMTLWTIVILSICILFKDNIENIVDAWIVNPVFNTWKDNNTLLTMGALSVPIILLYILLRKKIQSEGIFSNRRTLLFYIAVVLLFFRISGDYDYYGYNLIKYHDVVLIEVFIIEIIFIIIRCHRKDYEDHSLVPAIPFSTDAPTTKDDFVRSHFAETIINKIRATNNSDEESSAFTILLSEKYGVGKSSFFKRIEDQCANFKNICCFYFRPWLCDSVDLMTSNFITRFQEKIGVDDETLYRMLDIYADILNGKPSGRIINAIVKHKEHLSLEEQHDRISEILRKNKKKYLVLIDDVDRLQYKELVELIKIIRNTADFPNVFYLVAADKDAIVQSLKLNGKIEDPELYLQKFFNYELLLPACESGGMDNILCNEIQLLLSHYGFQEIQQQLIIKTIIGKKFEVFDVFKNPREIKRFVNLLSVELDSLNSEIKNKDGENAVLGDKYICIEDLMKLTLIKYLRPDVYKILRDNNAHFILSMKKPSKQIIIAEDNKAFFGNVFQKRSPLGKPQKIELALDFIDSDSQIDTNEKSYNSFAEIIDSCTPTTEFIVKELFIELWSENRGITDKPAINKNDEFFKYFAGRFRQDEVTFYEVESFMKEPVKNNVDSSPEFLQWLQDSIYKNKAESIINKATRLNVPYENRFEVIVNVFTCVRKNYEYEKLLDNRYKLSDSYEEWNEIIRLLLRKNLDCEVPDELYDRFHSFFSSTTNFEECALFLEQLGVYLYWETQEPDKLIPCVFSREQYNDYSRIIIDRAFSERILKEPYSIETFDLHVYLKRANIKYWIEIISRCIRESDYPMEWLYGALYWDEHNKKYYWNPFLCKCIYGEMELADSIGLIFGELLPDDYRTTLKQLPSPFENRGYGIPDNESRLFNDIKQWQLEGNNHFPAPELFYIDSLPSLSNPI